MEVGLKPHKRIDRLFPAINRRVIDAQLKMSSSVRFSLYAELKENGFDHFFSLDDISVNKNLQAIERANLWNGNNWIPHAYYFVILDLDQEINTYNVDSTRTDQYIELLRYDSINHIVEGRFQTFLEGPTTWWFLPDSMAMTEGKFHLKIK